MYKTRNTGTGNRMRRTQGMGECYILGNCAKHTGEYPQTFQGMLPNILRNVVKYPGECPQTFQGMLPNISNEFCQTFRGMSSNFPGMSPSISWNVAKHSVECCQNSVKCRQNSVKCRQTFRRMLPNVPENVLKQSREYSKIIWGMLPNTDDHELYLFTEEPFLLKSIAITTIYFLFLF